MKILVYPTFDNPYQRLLYNEIKKNKDINITYFDIGFYQSHYVIGLLLFPIRLIYYRLKGYSIFHLHWQHFEVPFFLKYFTYLLSTIFVVFILFFLKLLNFKIIWTVHNVVPHHRIFINDLWITKLIIIFSSKVIVHSTDTKDTLIKMGFNTDKFVVISQGSFINEYPNTVTKKEAREHFEISQDEFVILYFGLIREYKGLDDLLLAFKNISDLPKITLLLAGQILDNDYEKQLLKKINLLDKNIIHSFTYIPDDMLQYYFNASDIVVLPFKKITNSSSAMLSFSFGKPIIAPNLAGLSNLPKEIGYFYKENSEIAQVINHVIKNQKELKSKSIAAKDFAHSITWNEAGMKTYKLYKNLSQ